MDINAINTSVANISVKFNTVKDLSMTDENYQVGMEAEEELNGLVDSIGATQYAGDERNQVKGSLNGPIKTLAGDMKVYDDRRMNYLSGLYDVQKNIVLEAQKAFEERQKGEGMSASEFFTNAEEQAQEMTPEMAPEMTQELGKEKTLTLTPTNPGTAA